MNVFDYASAAERYARARPNFQPLVADRVARVCSNAGRILDVGCGTGQSTRALAEIGTRAIGADASLPMLQRAEAHPRTRYVASLAEALPFDDGAFDLVAAGLAFHWFDRSQFLSEARRVLRADGWLVIFNDSFCGEMTGNGAYARWNAESYVKRFPPPLRNAAPFTEADALCHGFALHTRDEFTHAVPFTPEQLVRYLLTQSNVIAAAEGRAEDIDSIRAWLAASVKPLFTEDAAEFPFRCVLDIFQKRSKT